MSSETITRNDLANILNEVLTASSGMTVEDISDKITFTGAWSNYMRKAYLIGGKFVFFTLEGYAGAIMQGTQYTIATIASGYRPKDNLAFTGHATNSGYLPQSIVNCYVWTGGDITVRCSNANGNYVFVSGWYALAENSAPVIVADYIVEQGTSGIWTYRKWNSGIAECWGEYETTITHYASAFGGYAYNTSVDYPTGLFISAPQYTYSAKVGSGFALTGTRTGVNKDYANLYAVCTTSGSQATSWDISVKGRWK